MKKTIVEFLAVGGGGAIGAMARFAVSRAFAWSTFPIGTLVINITGSLFLGWFATFAGKRLGMPETLYMAIAIGFVGAYTTFSTFMYESDKLFGDGAFLSATL